MTERREGPGDAKDDVRDEATEKRKDATPDAVEEEEATGGGGVKNDADDDLRKTRE